ncbi:hypothetical protein IHE44_0014718 [Lamprotornis superbus]|uniref:Uncharacterized protein n=1 Tax=Lamprotornis superbus TaxID=245042 RepID=A0A835NLC0_9PASS|nr:hypothetical protein IHE44_0014718 [Lamprotornis superbus]
MQGARCAPPAPPAKESLPADLRDEGSRVSAARLEFFVLQHKTLLLSPAGSCLSYCLKLTIHENASFYFVQTDKIQVALNHVSVQEQEPCLGLITFGFRLVAIRAGHVGTILGGFSPNLKTLALGFLSAQEKVEASTAGQEDGAASCCVCVNAEGGGGGIPTVTKYLGQGERDQFLHPETGNIWHCGVRERQAVETQRTALCFL